MTCLPQAISTCQHGGALILRQRTALIIPHYTWFIAERPLASATVRTAGSAARLRHG